MDEIKTFARESHRLWTAIIVFYKTPDTINLQ